MIFSPVSPSHLVTNPLREGRIRITIQKIREKKVNIHL